MALSQNHIVDVCDAYSHDGNKCRYLDEELVEDSSGNLSVVHICRKKSPDKQAIDDDLQRSVNEHIANGMDPAQSGLAMGDNCDGYVILKTTPQGYDVD